MSERKEFRLSAECLEHLNQIKQTQGLGTLTATVEYAARKCAEGITNHDAVQEVLHIADLNKKYLNELRRSTYVIIALLNALMLSPSIDIPAVPMHHEKNFRSPELLAAQSNLEVFLADVLTHIKHGEKGING